MIGIIPSFLMNKEVAHNSLSELIITPDMATRRIKMMDLADGFIALPGGIGTLDELFEVLSAAQLKLHKKPTGLLNSYGFYDSLITILKEMVNDKFMPKENLSLFIEEKDPNLLLNKMKNYSPTYGRKWQIPDYLIDKNSSPD